eukprot:10964752-Heterocapsa_arctica.AAC.1
MPGNNTEYNLLINRQKLRDKGDMQRNNQLAKTFDPISREDDAEESLQQHHGIPKSQESLDREENNKDNNYTYEIRCP